MEEQARKDKEEKARKVKERAMQLKEVKVVKKLVAKPKGGAEGSQGSYTAIVECHDHLQGRSTKS